MSNNINWKALQEKFHPDEIEWRLQSAGEKNGRIWAICLCYVTNRAIMNRLDEVVGPGNWRNEFRQGPDGGVLCGLSVLVRSDDGRAEWVTKWDGAENTDVEGVKGGLSGSMKRAAVQWGIGRYLYYLEENFAEVAPNGKNSGKTKSGTFFKWNPPTLPAWALPDGNPERVEGESRVVAAEVDPLTALVGYIKAVGPKVSDDAEVSYREATYNLKSFVREHWTTIQKNGKLALHVAQAIADSTGEPLP